ncbi:MAG: iron chaperone, partial [Candidatus Limnocylindrales bacterium]
MADTKTPTKRSEGTSGNVWSDEERAVMKESARERKVAARRSPADERVLGERDVQAKIAEMPEHEQAIARRIHEIVLTSAPVLVPKTYYGMPAYGKDGKTVCFFKPASKFKERYSTFGFEQSARLDDGAMWPTSYALTKLTPADEARIV